MARCYVVQHIVDDETKELLVYKSAASARACMLDQIKGRDDLNSGWPNVSAASAIAGWNTKKDHTLQIWNDTGCVEYLIEVHELFK